MNGVCVVGVKKCNLSKCCSMYPDNSPDTPLTAIVTIVIKVLLHSFSSVYYQLLFTNFAPEDDVK